MLANRANAAAIADFLDAHKFVHVVLDPVSRPTAGNAELLDAAGLKFVRDELLRRVSVITPNIPEAEFLTGIEVKDLHGMKAAGKKLLEMGARAVVVTGGHLEKPIDVLCEGNDVDVFGGDHVKSPNTHGSGCTFSSAIAAQLGQRPATPPSRDPREGLRHQGHREVLRHRQRRRPAQPAFPLLSGTAAARRPRSAAARHASCRRTHRPLIALICLSDEFCGNAPTIVATGPPRKLRPSKGVLRDLLGESAARNVHA